MFSDVVERRFRVRAGARLVTENVAGDTVVRAKDGDEIVVRATKHAEAENADRARRFFENLVVEIDGDEDVVAVRQRAYLAEHDWAGLFRDRRAWADYEIEVPPGCEVVARSTSGEVSVAGIRAPCQVVTVSGGAQVMDARGHVGVKTVSGDIQVSEVAGELDTNSVSGDLTVRGAALAGARMRAVSGDVSIEARLEGADEFVIGTVSGDVTLTTPSGCDIAFTTRSGELIADRGVLVGRMGKRHSRLRIGEGGARVHVSTMSGDLRLVRTDVGGPPLPSRDAEGHPEGKPDALGILERVERSELSPEEAARLLDALRR